MKKRLLLTISAFLAVVTVCVSLAPFGRSLKVTRYYGDVNCDGHVTLQDVIVALESAIHIYPRELTGMDVVAGDINGSGEIDTDDARKILRITSGLDKKTVMTSYDFSVDVNGFLNLCNTQRINTDSTLPLLTTSKELCAVAEDAAREFATKTGTALRRSDGSYYYKALNAAGISYTVADKFIQTSGASTEMAFENMMLTLQNEKSICNRNFKKVGIGAYSSDARTFYWCVILIG